MDSVPTHLVHCLKVVQSEERTIHGLVQCTCGSKVFSLLFPGTTMELKGRQFPYGKVTEDGVFFTITAKCVLCDVEHILFDKDFHGWDGFVCHSLKRASRPRLTLEVWKCLSCGSKGHTVEITLSYSDNMDEDIDGFPIENMADAFEWITIAIQCQNCGLVTEKWIDYETA